MIKITLFSEFIQTLRFKLLLCIVGANLFLLQSNYAFTEKANYLPFTIDQIQDSGTISGVVKDENGQTLGGVNISIVGTKIGTASYFDGRFKLTNVPSGKQTIKLSYMGFKTLKKSVEILANQTITINFTLQEDMQSMDEIIVTASRVKERVDEVPVSSVVVSSAKIQNMLNVTSNLNESLSQLVPGLAPTTNTNSNWGQTLRGRQLLVMIDGVPQSTPLRNGKVNMRSLDANVIERVEVIKGATATYGNGGDGGLINYITKQPTTGKALISRTRINGSGSLVKMDNSLGFGLNQLFSGELDKFSYMVNLGFEQVNDKVDDEGDILLPIYSLGNTESYNLFSKFVYQINDNNRLQFTASKYYSRQKPTYTVVEGGQFYDEATQTYYIKKAYGEEGDVEGGVQGPSNLNVNLKYISNSIFTGTDFAVDAYYQSTDNIFFWSPSFENGGQSKILSKKIGTRPYLNTAFESGTVFGNITYGIDILNDVTSQPLVDGRIWVPEMDLVNLAPYLQLKANLNNRWVFKGGVRLDKISINVNDYNTLPYDAKGTGVFTPSILVKGDKLKYNNVSFNAGIRYIENNHFKPYVSFSQGFSMPDMGFTLRNAIAPAVEQISLEASVTNNFEFGFASKFDRVKFEAVGYYSHSNLGTGIKLNDELNRFEPVRDPQNIFGVEVILDLEVTDKILVGSSYSYVEGIKEDNNSLSYIGGDLISPPKLTAYVNFNATDKLSLNLNYLHVGDRKRFNPLESGLYNYRQAPIEGYTVVSLAAGYKVNNNLRLNLAVNNLLNEDYFPARSQWASPLKRFSVKGEGTTINLSAIIDL